LTHSISTFLAGHSGCCSRATSWRFTSPSMGSGLWSFARTTACRTRSRSCLSRRQVVTSSFAESVDRLTGDRGGQEVDRSFLVPAERQDGQASPFCERRSDDTPTRAAGLADASVDPTEARSVAGSGPDAWAVRRGGTRPGSVPSPPTRPRSHPGGPTAPSHRTRAFLVTWAIPTFAFNVADLLVVAGGACLFMARSCDGRRARSSVGFPR
jgi:hypothetical protein